VRVHCGENIFGRTPPNPNRPPGIDGGPVTSTNLAGTEPSGNLALLRDLASPNPVARAGSKYRRASPFGESNMSKVDGKPFDAEFLY